MQSNQCITCRHYWGGFKCNAFEDRIPQEILNGMFDHDEPYPNAENPTDNGIRWQDIDITVGKDAPGRNLPG